jgi:hypothetical protein
MRFFTPDLYARLQASDTSAMDVADADWKAAEANYERRLQVIRPQLPSSVQSFLDSIRLHDAEVLWIGRASPRLSILLRLDQLPRGTILLTYEEAEIVSLEAGTFPKPFQGPTMQWMYDEIDLGACPARFAHLILFSDGKQMAIEAAELQTSPIDTLYAPASAAGVTAS